MRHDGWLKFLVTLLIIVTVAVGYLVIETLDRVRATNIALREAVEELRKSGMRQAVTPSTTTEVKRDVRLANAEYFDPNAEIGDRLVTPLMSEPPNLNSLICNEYIAAVISGKCTCPLAESDLKDPENYQPMLAESWEISPDRLRYRIKLRRGVMWQDCVCPVTGKRWKNVEVTARDFAFFFEVVRNPDVNCAPTRSYFKDFDKLVIINDYEFEVVWKKAFYGSKSHTLGLTPLPRHFYCPNGKFSADDFNFNHKRNRMVVGCGPYRFARWERDKRIVLERDDKFFGNAYGVGASVKTLIYEVIKNPNTQFQALLSGSVDELSMEPEQWCNRTNVPAFQNGELKKHKYLNMSYSYIGYNQKNPLFRDKRVRQALTMAIDRETIRREIYRNLCEISTGPFHPLGPYAAKIKPWAYDVARAKKLLAEAGWRDTDGDGILEKDGKKFSFTMLQIANSSIQEKMMPMLKEYFAAIGVEMKIRIVEWSVYIEILNKRSFDACQLGWTSGFDADLYQVWHSSQCDGNGSNHIAYSNPELDKLIEQLREEFDLTKRKELARRCAELLHEEQPYTFLFVPYTLTAVSGRYRNVRVFPTGIPNILFWTPAQLQKTPTF